MPTPIPTVPVTCSARDQTGAALAGGKFEAKLDRVERYGGFLVPQAVTGIADADGVCVLNLWPNSLGTAGSTYRVRAWHGGTGTRYLDAVALVPNAACALQGILIAQPLPPVNEARQALAAAQAALAPVTAQAHQSLLNADRADDAKNAAEIAAVAALTHSQSAALSSFEATAAASGVQADVVTVVAQAAAAQQHKDAAALSASQAASDALSASASTGAAATSAGQAAGSATAAASSKDAAATSATAAAGSASGAAASEAGASGSAVLAGQRADAAALSAASANTAAGQAATSATAAAQSALQAGIHKDDAQAAAVAAAAERSGAQAAAAVALQHKDDAAASATLASQHKDAAAASAVTAAAASQIHTTEALGRAAVADGQAFKVQGSGDVASYEYRRVSAGESTLIATYPSALSVINADMAVITSAGSIVIDLTAKTISVEAGTIVMYKARHVTLPAQTVGFAGSVSNPARIWMLPSTGDVGVSVASSGELPPAGSVLLGFIAQQRFIGNDPAGKVVVRPTAGAVSLGYADPLSIFTAGTIHVNQQTLMITTGATAGYVSARRGYVAVKANQSVSYAFTFVNGIGFVYVDPITGIVGVTNYANNPPSGFPIVAMIDRQKLYSISGEAISYTNAAGVSQMKPSVSASLSAAASLTINMQTKQLVLTGAGVVGIYEGGYINIAAQTAAFVAPNVGFLGTVYANRTSGVIGAAFVGSEALPANSAVLAYVFEQKLYAPHDYRRRISLINSSGVAVPAAYDTAGAIFNQTTHRMILPESMYFIPSTPLRLYRAPCFADYSDAVKKDISLWLDTMGADIGDRFQPVGDSIKLDPSQLAASFEIGFRHPSQPNTRYIKTIARNVAAPGSLAGKSLTMLTIGDSLTEGGMGAEFKNQIEAQGATVTPVGTYISVANSSLPSEGRGYWNYRSFIGKDNYSAGIGAHTRSGGGKTTTTKFENPFLKLADATDKANHPDWCFRFTGVDKELSYTDDPVKTGDFYIFDFAWYRAQHTVAAPDFITIALSTNDINLDVGAYSTAAERLAFMRLGLDVMVRQIKADLPSVKIGIIPAPAWSSTLLGDSVWQSETAAWIENCITDVVALSLTFSGLYIVPVWPFMNEDMAFPYSSSTALSAVNTEKVKTITDWVHFDLAGRKQYANVVAAWAANVL